MSHLVHWAGNPVRAGNVIRQRCVWCGALIDEKDLDRIAFPVEDLEDGHLLIEEDGTPKPGWVGLVAVEEHGENDVLGMVAKWAVDEPGDGKIPPDSCMALPAEVTA